MQMTTTTKNNASSKNAAVKSNGLTNEEKLAIYNEIAVQKKEAEMQAKEQAKASKKERDEIVAKIKENKKLVKELQLQNKELMAQCNALYEPIRQLRK